MTGHIQHLINDTRENCSHGSYQDLCKDAQKELDLYHDYDGMVARIVELESIMGESFEMLLDLRRDLPTESIDYRLATNLIDKIRMSDAL